MIEVKVRFYSVQEKLPEKSGYYVCITDDGNIRQFPYSAKFHLFNASDNADLDDAYTWSIECAYWANLEDFAELTQLKEWERDEMAP